MSKPLTKHEDFWVYCFVAGFIVSVPLTLWLDHTYLSPLDPGSALMIPFAMVLSVVAGGVFYLAYSVGSVVERWVRKR